MAGKRGAYEFIKAVTNNEATAKAFVDNHNKFMTNIFKGVKSVSQVTAENTLKVDELKQNFNIQVANERVAISERKAQLSTEMDRNFFSLKQKNRDILNSVKDRSKIDIDTVSKQSSEAYSKTVDTVKTDFKVRSANTTASVRGTGFTFGNDVLLVEHGTVLYQDTLFNNALAQSGEQYQYAKYLYSIVENIETLVAGYELTAKPLGLADSDDLPEGYVAGTGNAGGAQLIIKITVTK